MMPQRPAPARRDPTRSDADAAEITFIGTATALLQIAGFSILTDPNFMHRGGRVSVGMGLTTRRHTEPGHVHRPAAAPRLVALSRHHGDHFDRIAAAQLDHDLTVITEPRAARKLRSQGFRRPIALSTWDSQTIVRGGTLLHDGWVTSPAAIPALTCASFIWAAPRSRASCSRWMPARAGRRCALTPGVAQQSRRARRSRSVTATTRCSSPRCRTSSARRRTRACRRRSAIWRGARATGGPRGHGSRRRQRRITIGILRP